MDHDNTPMPTDPGDRNNFGLLRLSLAVLVALSHSFAFVDDSPNRDPLFRIFHVLTFGDFAVDCFFVISGFLVTKSFLQSQSNSEYLGKRVLRIYPGFVVASGVSLLIGAIAGGTIPRLNAQTFAAAYVRLFFFNSVHLDNAFAGLPYPNINGSMWTIAYEFRCYLALIVFGRLGILSRRYFVGGLAALLLLATTWFPEDTESPAMVWFFGDGALNVRFLALFVTGCVFYIFRDIIRYKWNYALLCFGALLALLYFRSFATVGIAIFGAYAIFWFAFKGPISRLSNLLNKTDLSYGFYLYAWPVGNLIVWFHRSVSVPVLFLYTVGISGAMAYVSWKVIEKPALNMKRYLTPKHGFRPRRRLEARSAP